MIIKFFFLFILYILIMPEAEALLVYSYDGEGNRHYYRVDPADYQKNKSRKYAHIYETKGPRGWRYYTKEDRDKYWEKRKQRDF